MPSTKAPRRLLPLLLAACASSPTVPTPTFVAALADVPPMDGWTVAGLAVAAVLGGVGLGLILRREAALASMPSPQALCSEHVAETPAASS